MTDVAVSEARGFSLAERPLPAVIANIKDSPRARSFTLIHELVHVALRESGVCTLDDAERVEVFCNYVAGAVLVPADALRADLLVAEHGSDPEWAETEIEALARRFSVSREVVLRRLLILDRTTEPFYRRKRREYQEAYRAGGRGAAPRGGARAAADPSRPDRGRALRSVPLRARLQQLRARPHHRERRRRLLRRPDQAPARNREAGFRVADPKRVKYSLGTSSLINGFRLNYPYIAFPRLWNEHIPELVASGAMRATEEVLIELRRQDDELVQWIADYMDELFIEVDEPIQHEVKAILRTHTALIHTGGRGHSGADPFVIALAKLHIAAVVTEEGHGSAKRPKIPDVCDDLGVPCIRLADLIVAEGWQYG